MRTLLVDNYDSFTYNLFHYLSRANGREPEVIRNDDPAWRPGLLDAFDNVVLSPGPGTPHRPADFGLCARIAEEGPAAGARRLPGPPGHGPRPRRPGGPGPEPRHGRTSAVRHDGTGLFEGLPQPLEVVRYHSLAVTELPPELEATAWSEDGVLMALRHRTLPLWGVQFHPESIGTRDGHRLLANFRDLTERHGRTRPGGRAARGTLPPPRPPGRRRPPPARHGGSGSSPSRCPRAGTPRSPSTRCSAPATIPSGSTAAVPGASWASSP